MKLYLRISSKDVFANDGAVDVVAIDEVTLLGTFSARSLDPRGSLVLFRGKQFHSVNNFDVITRLG